jgi:hypothetical protein
LREKENVIYLAIHTRKYTILRFVACCDRDISDWFALFDSGDRCDDGPAFEIHSPTARIVVGHPG